MHYAILELEEKQQKKKIASVIVYQCLKARAMDRELNQCVICHLWTGNIRRILSYPKSRVSP